jgi:NADPH:quinone reductase-like Zn-dependent oxidoreductase
MKAILFTEYGSPDVLTLTEVEKPVPNADQVLVKIHAASANPLDWHRMRGAPFLARLSEGYRKPKDIRIGADIAGEVEAVGGDVTQFKPGDKVFGCIDAGGFAEYVAVKETSLVMMPPNASYAEASGMPIIGLTALQGLRDTGKIQSGQTVLVNGASGGVGHCAVQIAKSYGAEVTGVCSGRNVEMVREIGADHVIDYTQQDFSKTGQQYDLIYDAVGNRSVSAYRRALKPNGICAIAGFTTLPRLFGHIIIGGLSSRFGSKTVGLMGTAQVKQPDLQALADLMEAGKIKVVIDRTYPLEETADAIRYLETMRARGKVIIDIAHAN